MITVDEALALVLAQCRPKPAARLPVADALGLLLAEPIESDVDSPPWDKSMVDGYAIQAADLREGFARLTILEEVVAGAVPSRDVRSGATTRIMTGAPIPIGCDAVVMVEKTTLVPGEQPTDSIGTVEIRDQVKTDQNILRRGVALTRGDVVLRPGHEIRPIEIGLLCEVGRREVSVIPAPRVAVLSTGNELIPPGNTPRPGQIRNSNGPMLAASVQRAGATPVELGIARDERAELTTLITRGLTEDILVLSGGVSAGVLDLVPRVLQDLHVEQVFHKLRLKPGKPLWFGVGPARAGGERCLVFGLPGNPVSSLVCFELFVLAAIAALSGKPVSGLRKRLARLATSFNHRGDRPTYHPARLRYSEAGPIIEPLRWQGSADLYGLANANALVHFPAGDRSYQPGESLEALIL